MGNPKDDDIGGVGRSGPTTAYCVKCRTKREIKHAKEITLRNKRPAVTGTCPTCGTKMFRIGKA